MTSNYYELPSRIASPLTSIIDPDEKLLVPRDPKLADQLRGLGFETEAHEGTDHVFETSWWRERDQKFDWVVANTTGLREEQQYILDYGIAVAKHGLIILDRLSFLEPVRSRKKFLLNNKLSDLMILSPRPRFSSISSARDSVTSAWFVFRKPEDWLDGANLRFALDWQTPPPLADESH